MFWNEGKDVNRPEGRRELSVMKALSGDVTKEE